MTSSTPDRLSSDNLYHFKKDVSILSAILEKGFRHNLLEEAIPYKNAKQQNFMVCFCDIRFEESDLHRLCYGQNGIVLTKEWGIRLGVTPVRYIHQNSVGGSDAYISLKNGIRKIRASSADDTDTATVQYLIFALLRQRNRLRAATIEASIAIDASLQGDIDTIEDELLGVMNDLRLRPEGKTFLAAVKSVYIRVNELHNELERRDAFQRIYQADYGPFKNKVLYDEREWRSIKNISNLDLASTPSLLGTAMSQGYLPESYNLTFTDHDIVAMIAEGNTEKQTICDAISSNKTMLSSISLAKVFTVAEYTGV
jgi:hypothetical protein